jgi:hypothetical protein
MEHLIYNQSNPIYCVASLTGLMGLDQRLDTNLVLG